MDSTQNKQPEMGVTLTPEERDFARALDRIFGECNGFLNGLKQHDLHALKIYDSNGKRTDRGEFYADMFYHINKASENADALAALIRAGIVHIDETNYHKVAKHLGTLGA